MIENSKEFPEKFSAKQKALTRINLLVFAPFLILSLTTACRAGPFEDGLAASKRGDYKTAFPLLCVASASGDKRALYEHSRILYAEGLERDFRAAKICWRKALKAGLVEAAIELGFIEHMGFGGDDMDFFQSYIYYKIALIHGFKYNGITARDVERQLEMIKPLLDEQEIKVANRIADNCYPRMVIPCFVPKGTTRDYFINSQEK